MKLTKYQQSKQYASADEQECYDSVRKDIGKGKGKFLEYAFEITEKKTDLKPEQLSISDARYIQILEDVLEDVSTLQDEPGSLDRQPLPDDLQHR